jgi:hypothetical protein
MAHSDLYGSAPGSYAVRKLLFGRFVIKPNVISSSGNAKHINVNVADDR